jgi:hypothetical protein
MESIIKKINKTINQLNSISAELFDVLKKISEKKVNRDRESNLEQRESLNNEISELLISAKKLDSEFHKIFYSTMCLASKSWDDLRKNLQLLQPEISRLQASLYDYALKMPTFSTERRN